VIPCDLSLITIHISNPRQFSDIHISQGSVATYLRCHGMFKYELQIYHWVCQRKNYENRLTFGEVMGKSLVSCLWTHGVYAYLMPFRRFGVTKIHTIVKWEWRHCVFKGKKHKMNSFTRHKLQKQWNKCIVVCGDYVEKWSGHITAVVLCFFIYEARKFGTP